MFKSDQVVVSSSAVELTAGFDTDQEYELRIEVAPNIALWIGDSTVDPSTNGYPLPTGITTVRPKGDKVYGYAVAGAPATIYLLAVSD